jgi:hypothetical protein
MLLSNTNSSFDAPLMHLGATLEPHEMPPLNSIVLSQDAPNPPIKNRPLPLRYYLRKEVEKRRLQHALMTIANQRTEKPR